MQHTLPDSPAHHYVDGLLKSFFQGQLPEPWPDAPAAMPDRGVTLGRPAHARRWFSNLGRLGLVASVAAILLGYLTLAAKFPLMSDSPGLEVDRSQMIGLKPGIKYEAMPHGGKALIREWMVPAVKGERPTIIINVEEIEAPKQP